MPPSHIAFPRKSFHTNPPKTCWPRPSRNNSLWGVRRILGNALEQLRSGFLWTHVKGVSSKNRNWRFITPYGCQERKGEPNPMACYDNAHNYYTRLCISQRGERPKLMDFFGATIAFPSNRSCPKVGHTLLSSQRQKHPSSTQSPKSIKPGRIPQAAPDDVSAGTRGPVMQVLPTRETRMLTVIGCCPRVRHDCPHVTQHCPHVTQHCHPAHMGRGCKAQFTCIKWKGPCRWKDTYLYR